MIPALIKAGATIAGGLISSSSAKKSRKLQKQALKEGIQWKVADAKKAGIHPLYALGASTNMPAPITGSAVGDAISDAGQHIAEGVRRNRSPSGGQIQQLTQAKIKAEIQETQSRAHLAQNQADMVQLQMHDSVLKRAQQEANVIQGPTEMYTRIYDNRPGKDSTPFYAPSKEVFEIPESIGAYYWGKSQIQKPSKKPYPGGNWNYLNW